MLDLSIVMGQSLPEGNIFLRSFFWDYTKTGGDTTQSTFCCDFSVWNVGISAFFFLDFTLPDMGQNQWWYGDPFSCSIWYTLEIMGFSPGSMRSMFFFGSIRRRVLSIKNRMKVLTEKSPKSVGKSWIELSYSWIVHCQVRFFSRVEIAGGLAGLGVSS